MTDETGKPSRKEFAERKETEGTGTYREYWETVKHYAESALDTTEYSEDTDVDDRVHEMVDGSEWVIYYWRNLKVLEHTRHFDACDESAMCAVDSLQASITQGAYFAMFADVQEQIQWNADQKAKTA
jgi:hypothetical protein